MWDSANFSGVQIVLVRQFPKQVSYPRLCANQRPPALRGVLGLVIIENLKTWTLVGFPVV